MTLVPLNKSQDVSFANRHPRSEQFVVESTKTHTSVLDTPCLEKDNANN